MDHVTVYLRTALFSFGGPEAHLPSGVMAIEGTLESETASAITMECERFLDARGREILDEAMSLRIPWEKIDHVVIAE